MKTTIMNYLVIVAVASCMSCQSSKHTLSPADRAAIVERARIMILTNTNLDEASREIVKTNDPKLYFNGLPFGGIYTYCWVVSSNRTVEIDAINDIQNLTTNSIIIRQIR